MTRGDLERLRAGVRRPTHRALEHVPHILLRPLLRHQPFGLAFDAFERYSSERVTLFAGYRDAVKRSWRAYWWPTRILLDLSAQGRLTAEAAALAALVTERRTLPVPIREVADAVGALVDRLPEALRPTEVVDEHLRVPVVELIPSTADLQSRAASYRADAANVAAAVSRAGVEVRGARVLDVGSGSGYLAFALAAAGAAEVVGVDVATATHVPHERERMRTLLAGDQSGAVRLEEGDVHSLEYEPGSFDIVCSISAIEHFRDARLALQELRRMLRRGGVAFHGVDPWFGKRGGHALCTLDFPWGHLRLDGDEMESYLRRLRPYEADNAIQAYAQDFQQPHLTLAQSRAALADAGFELLEWHELPMGSRDPHRAVLDGTLLEDVRRRHPAATKRDLLTLNYTVVARAI